MKRQLKIIINKETLAHQHFSPLFPDHQTEDRQQPVRQRFQGLVSADGHGEVQGLLGPALSVCVSVCEACVFVCLL